MTILVTFSNWLTTFHPFSSACWSLTLVALLELASGHGLAAGSSYRHHGFRSRLFNYQRHNGNLGVHPDNHILLLPRANYTNKNWHRDGFAGQPYSWNILVHPKDTRDITQTAKCVYEIPCLNCDKSYIGDTSRQFGLRLMIIKQKRKTCHRMGQS